MVRWERGITDPQPWVRPRLAEALNLSLRQLDDLLRAGTADVPTLSAKEREEVSGSSVSADDDAEDIPAAIAILRRLVDVYDLPEDGPVRSLTELNRAVSGIVQNRLDANYLRLVEQLRTLLPELTRGLLLYRGAHAKEVALLLVQAYRAADAVAAKFGFYDLSARIIQVMQWAADQSEDEYTLAAANYVRTETFFVSVQLEAGRRMLEQTAAQISPGASTRAAAAYGSLHMRAAVAAARAGLSERSHDHRVEARRAARSVNEGVYDGTAFGPGSVCIHEVTLALDLDAPDRALAAAAGWAPPESLPAERRSHFYVDIARAQLRTGRHELVLDALGSARTIAPEHIRGHPQVREVLAALASGGEGHASAVRQFATAAGMATGDGRALWNVSEKLGELVEGIDHPVCPGFNDRVS